LATEQTVFNLSNDMPTREQKRKYSKTYYDKHKDSIPKRPNKYKKTPEQARRYRLKNLYKITPEQWDDMYQKQGGKCANLFCDTTISNKRYDRLFVDHCHYSGVVRGLLCHSCNIAMGLQKDCPNRLQGLVNYLNMKR
jgi:hypothetical protein